MDAAGSCSQKCIGAAPGLGPVTFGPRALEAVRRRRGKPSTWYFDLGLLFQYWGEAGGSKERAFHHTAPVAAIYGFREALRAMLDEGLEARWQRVVAIVRLSSLRRGVFGFFNHQLAEQGQKTSELLHIPSGSLITLRVIVIAAKPNGKNLKLIS